MGTSFVSATLSSDSKPWLYPAVWSIFFAVVFVSALLLLHVEPLGTELDTATQVRDAVLHPPSLSNVLFWGCGAPRWCRLIASHIFRLRFTLWRGEMGKRNCEPMETRTRRGSKGPEKRPPYCWTMVERKCRNRERTNPTQGNPVEVILLQGKDHSGCDMGWKYLASALQAVFYFLLYSENGTLTSSCVALESKEFLSAAVQPQGTEHSSCKEGNRSTDHEDCK